MITWDDVVLEQNYNRIALKHNISVELGLTKGKILPMKCENSIEYSKQARAILKEWKIAGYTN